MYTAPDPLHEEFSPRPFLSPSMKHSTMFSKPQGNQQLTFTNKSQLSFHLNSHVSGKKNQFMTKSMIKKETDSELDVFVREMAEKIASLERTVAGHNRQISEIKQSKSKTTSYYSSSDSFYKNQSGSSISPQMVKFIKMELQKDDQSYSPHHPKLPNNFSAEISSLRSNLESNFVLKSDLAIMFQKLQSNMSHLLPSAHTITKELNDTKHRIKVQSQQIYAHFQQELHTKIKNIHDISQQNFNDLNICVQNIKLTIQSMKQEYKPTFVTNMQKCYSPKLIKYQQIIQKVVREGVNEKEGEKVVLNQVVYYMDMDGYLLDSNCYYLLDRNGKQIKVDTKQLAIFTKYNLL